MNDIFNQIKNYIQLHTSDMENEAYADLMRSLADYATSQAALAEYQDDPNSVVFPIDE